MAPICMKSGMHKGCSMEKERSRMWNNIYQLSDRRLWKKDWITESDFHENSLSHATVKQVENRKSEIQRLGQWMERSRLGVIQNGILTLHGEWRKSPYFIAKHQRFLEIIANLAAVDLESFTVNGSSISDWLFRAEQEYEDGFSTMVCFSPDSLITLDQFLRTAQPDTPYYLGGVCQYHI